MRKQIILFTFLIFAAAISFAQTKTIKGKVTDDAGAPLSGISVLEKGSKKGTQTDAEGNFSIDVPEKSKTLVFSSVGFKSLTQTINGSDAVNVSLEKLTTTGDEVVVIGYQTVKRKDLTGSVSSVGSKQIKDIPVNSAAEALTGRLAGVQLTTTEGKPGSEVTIRVRGGGSITQDNTPLYIVDGVQIENALAVLNPQDIESVDLLKDASATAIYGARGSNGVMLITLKKGRAGKTIISYNGFSGVRQLANKLAVLKPYDFVRFQYDRYKSNTAPNSNTTDSTNFVRTYGTTFDTLENYRNIPFVDWQDELFGNNATFQSHNITLSGGSGNTQFNFGATTNKEDGILLNNSFERKLFTFSLDNTATSRLKVGISSRYNNTVVFGAGTSTPGTSVSNKLRYALKYKPLLLPGQEVEDFDAANFAETSGFGGLTITNPILYNESEYRKNITDVLNISNYATYKFNDYLSFKTTFGYDLTTGVQNAFDDSLSTNSRLYGAQPVAMISTNKITTFNNSNVLTYSNGSSKLNFAKRNSITALLGQEVFERRDQSTITESRYFNNFTKPEVALGNLSLGNPPAGVALVKPISFQVKSRIISGFGRINYTRDNRYLLTLSARTDGSSKFAEQNKYSFFPSGSVAWKFSEENFFAKIKNVVNEAKFRFSYGQAGNNRISDYLYTTTYSPNSPYGLNDQLVAGFASQSLENKDLVWEKTIAQNLGLDVSMFRGRLSFTIDAYKNTTKDLLVNVPIPGSSGYNGQLQNVGSTENEGLEFQITATPVATKNVNYTTSFNISFNKNKVLDLGDRQNFFLQSSGWTTNVTSDYIVKVGDPVGSMYGFVTDGFYKIDDFNYNPTTQVYTLKAGVANNAAVTSTAPQPGTLKFKNLAGDSVIDANGDRRIIGDANPKFFGGFNQTLTFKNFDVSAFVNFQVGNDIYNANTLEFTSGYVPNTNLLEIVKDRFTNINAQGQVVRDPVALAALNVNAKTWTPTRAFNSFLFHSAVVEDGSFLRINNVTLGYTIPFAENSKISKLRFYVTGNNLKVFTKYSGYDPEVSTRRSSGVTPGVDYSAYPRSRSFIFGANLTL